MQHAVVFACRHNRCVGKLAAALDEFPRQLGFHLVLRHARLHKPQRAAKAFGRDVHCLLQQLDLQIRFHHAQFMQQRCQPPVSVQREIRLALLDEPHIARLHLHVRALVLVAVQVRALRLAH